MISICSWGKQRRQRFSYGAFSLTWPQHQCKFTEPKESIWIKEFNDNRTSLEHQQGRRFIVLEHQYGRRDENALLVQSLTFVSLESKRLRKLLCRKNIAADPVDETDTVLVAKRCGWTLTWSEATSYLASGSFTVPFRLRSFTQAKIIQQTMSTNTILETT